MKRILFIAALFLVSHTIVFAQPKLETPSATVPSSNKPARVVVNRIAFVVNDEIITLKELQERIRMVEQRLNAQGAALPAPAVLQRQVIERLIVDRAQLQLAREMGLRVDDVMLDRALSQMAEQNKMSLPMLRDQVEKEGIPYAQFREGIREDILLQRLTESEVGNKVQVSEAEIDNYLLAQKADKQKKQEVAMPLAHVRHILIKISPTVTKEQAKHKLLELKQRLERDKAPLDDLAKYFPDDTLAPKVEDLGWLHPGTLPEFDSSIDALKDGQISAPIETAHGVHLIQLLERKTGEVPPERQRLLARQAIHARKLEEAALEWMQQLRDRAYVEIRVNEN
ncbi:MAG: molecular chaperone SurA [Solimicrobium sp.]|jgi:peptidyl-prolyl cis-trans isomerase SurA|nr:molecular chaperone SurA [Solimicrobium sp.]